MSRQQRRKNERDNMKNNNGKKLQQEVSLFGVYYKSNKEEGFDIVMDERNPEVLKYFLWMYNKVVDLYVNDNHLFREDEVLHNLQGGIKFWNEYNNIQQRIPSTNYQLRFDTSDNNIVNPLFTIMYSIYHLLQKGVLVDDNNNGFHFLKRYKMVG